MATQPGLFDVEERLQRLSDIGDQLEPRFTSPTQGACDSMRLHACWRRSWQRNPVFLTSRNGYSG